jgi:uncharacterized protein YabN with tetrapyrrole methylase and pyrophosphatase domain
VLFHSVIAAEEGWFNMADVARGLSNKLVHRHPHVFGESAGSVDATEVLSNWEVAKREEKGRESLVEGIPPALPALSLTAKLERRSHEVLERAQRDSSEGRLGSLVELAFAGDAAAGGAALFCLAQLVSENGGDPEALVRAEAVRFRELFAAAERAAASKHTTIAEEFNSLEANERRAERPPGAA